MTTTLQAAVADRDRLHRSWEHTRARLAEDGTERLLKGEARDLSLHLADRLGDIRGALLDGSWTPGTLRKVVIRDHDGDARTLHVPSLADRLVERSVIDVLTPILDPLFSPWSFAYRRGIAVHDAIQALARLRDEGLHGVVRADVRDCFNRIGRGPLLARLAAEVDDEWLLDLVATLVARYDPTPGDPSDDHLGLAQGSPLSPLLANLFLDDFDHRLAAAGLTSVRFADDFVVVVPGRTAAKRAKTNVIQEAKAMGLDLKAEKGADTTFDQGFAFLGEDIGPVHPVAELAAVRDGQQLRKALYVTKDGAGILSRRGQLVVMDDGQELLAAPISLVSHVVMIGAVGLSSGARSTLLYEAIPATFLSRRGRWLGRLDAGGPHDASVRRKQYRAGDDPKARLELAQPFVMGKLANQRSLILRYRRRTDLPVLLGAANALRSIRRHAERCQDLNVLRGYEGEGSKVYFDALRSLFPDHAGFAGRNRRPPKDPANAALSFGYAILTGEATSALSTVGLDPVAGFLHDDRNKRPSLALDLMEELRPAIVDATVLDLFRRRALAPEHFRAEASPNAVLLTDAGRRRLLQGLEERLLTVFSHVPSGKRVTYRRAVTLQAQQIRNVLTGRSDSYEPISWR